jgi:hypothetical protein
MGCSVRLSCVFAKPAVARRAGLTHDRQDVSRDAETHIAGRLIADGGGHPSKYVIVQIFARIAVEESFIVPAGAEPLIVWILKGSATAEKRNIAATSWPAT